MCIFVNWQDLVIVSKYGFRLSEILIKVCVCVYLNIYCCLVNQPLK